MQSSLVPIQKGFRSPIWPLLAPPGYYTPSVYVDPKV